MNIISGRSFGRIGVLAGGPSNEREISLRSGRAVKKALEDEGCEAVFLDVQDDVSGVVKESRIDVAFIALHGRFGEDGTVQKILEDSRIPYTGSGVEASRLALDKIASREIFIKRQIPVPRYVVVERGTFRPGDGYDLDLPIVVKPQFEGSSIGLSIVREKRSLSSAIEKAFEYGDKVILEGYIEGRELTVGILDDAPLPVIEIVTRNRVYDYTAKYDDPETSYLIPAPVESSSYKNAQEMGRLSHLALGCRSFSRVDMMMDSLGNIYVLEVNTIPGMTERSLLPKAAKACGISFGRLCVKMIENALRF